MKLISVTIMFLFSLGLCFAQSNGDVIKTETIVCYEYPLSSIKTYNSYKEKLSKDVNVNKYKNVDTLLVYIRKSDSIKFGQNIRYTEAFKPYKIYDTTSLYNLRVNGFSIFSLVYKRYEDFDAMEVDSINKVLVKNKSYLIEKKNQVLTTDLCKNSSNNQFDYIRHVFFEIIKTKKKVYLIDENENSESKLFLRPIDLRRFVDGFYNLEF